MPWVASELSTAPSGSLAARSASRRLAGGAPLAGGSPRSAGPGRGGWAGRPAGGGGRGPRPPGPPLVPPPPPLRPFGEPELLVGASTRLLTSPFVGATV